MNKRGVHEHHGILVMLALGLLGIGLLLYSAGFIDTSSLSSGTAGLTGLAGGDLGTQEEPLSAAPANQPPTYTGSPLTTPADTPLIVDLAPLFTDPEGDALTFLATSEDQVSVDVTDSTATFTPASGFSGERTITIAVSDGTNLVREPVRLTVGDAAAAEFSTPTPEEDQTTEEPTQNETLPPPAEPSFGTQDIVTGCEPGPVVINTSTTLTSNISSNGTCITFGTSNISLNCAGFAIFFNYAGGSSDSGITANGRTNITVENCLIIDPNAGGTTGRAIDAFAINNSLITNTNITTNGTDLNFGIFLGSGSTNNTIANSTIRTFGSSSNNEGIDLNNAHGNLVIKTTIITNGTTNNHGVALFGHNNTLESLNISTVSGSSPAITLNGVNGTVVNNTILTDPAIWISSTTGSFTNFTNTTFAMPNGSIRIPGLVQVNETQSVTKARLNITFNFAYMNSSNLTFLNTTAIITLNGLTFGDPKPQFDFEDDGTFTECTSTADPFCTELGYAGGAFTFNTSHFTTFNATEGGILGCPATINTSTTLSTNLTSDGTCITFGADNIFLDCAGFNITYGTGGGSEVFGVNISNRNNATVRNCQIFKHSASGARTYGIAFLNSSNGLLVNNTIVTNGTEENDGIHTGVVASVNFTSNSGTVTLVTNDGNVNSPYCTNTTGLGLCQVCFDTAGVSCAALGQSGCPDGEGFKSDDILKFNVTSAINISSGNIQVIGGEAVFCNLNGNTTISFGTRNNCGSFRSATFSGAFFVAGENNLTCFVAGGGKDEDNGFKLVSFSYDGTTQTTTLPLYGNTSNLTATGNTVVADGSVNTRGIFLDAHNSNISFNSITTAGGNESHGVTLGSENTTIASNNITTTDGGKSRGIAVVAPNSNVTSNIITITGTAEEREGILVLANRTNLLFNNITTLSGRFSHGIQILGAILVNATGNNLSVGAGNGSHGILLLAANATLAQNNVGVNTSSLSHGITLPGSVATGNAITGNTISVNSRGGNALNVVIAAGNTFSGNTIGSANVSGVYLERALNNTFSGSTLALTAPSSLFILQDNGSINYTQALTLATSTNLARVVRITHNATFVNATDAGGSQLNGTALLRFFSLPGDGVIPVFDDADDGTFDVCGGSRCLNTTYNQSTGILQYNVTHFTTYAAQEVSACATIDNIENATTVNVTLTNNVSATIDCFTIVAENVTLTCSGNTILYDSAGIGGDGIIVEHTNNVVIRDCIIIDINAAGPGGIGINITNTSNVRLINNSIQTNGTNSSWAIHIHAFANSTQQDFSIVNNTARTRGSRFNNTGILISGANISNVTILNNTISTNGTDSNDGIRLSTIFTNSIIRNVRIIQNNILTNGSSFRNMGIFTGVYLGSQSGFVNTLLIANNTIRTFGASTINNGIHLIGTASNVTIEQNNITTNASGGVSGISFQAFNSASVLENITVRNNTITNAERGSSGGSNNAIGIENFAGAIIRNITILQNSITTNGTSDNSGVELTGATGIIIENNTIIASSTTFSGTGVSLVSSYANITIHNNLINTTGPGLDHGIVASGGIDPENITVTRNNISTGSRPGGTVTTNLGNNRGMYFTSVTGSLIRDNFVYTNGTFNNTGIFVGVSSSFNTVANNTVVTGGNESENAGIGLIQVKDEFGSVASNNVTNNTVNTTGFGRSPSNDIGILLMGLGNSGAVENNIIRINTVHARGNDSDNYGVYLVGIVRYNNITNNQVLTNGTDWNHGVAAFSPSTSFQVSDNIIEWNNITAWGIASTDNRGIFFHNLVVRNNVTDNNVTTRGSNRNHGAFLNASSNNNRIERNNFTLQTFGTDNAGIVVQGSSNNTVLNNFIQTNTSVLDGGIYLQFLAHSNRVSNNTIRTNGTVLKIISSRTNVIQDQNATARAGGALVIAGATLNNFTNVILASDAGLAVEVLPGAGDGAFFDGFEDGTIPPFTTSGNAPWLINNTNVSSGSFSAQAADINDSQSAVLTLSLTAGAGTVSFARKTDSESGFDFLTFAINGVTQQQWSGNLQYATFNFSFASASTFTWTYSKDSSIASGADTAWVDNINISFAGNGSHNNTFNQSFFLTNNSWLFMGENNTNNTIQNTTFTGPNGSLTIIPLVHIAQNSNATLGRLNNTHNLTFLNSTALRFLNTTAILRFLQILFIDPAPFRDLDDDGAFGYCPPSVCAELSYVTGEFVHNTTGFSFYAVSEGQVNLSINKTDNPDPVPVSSQLNYTIIVNNSGSSTAFNLTLLEIYPPEVIFLTAQPTPEAGTNNTFFLGNLTPESQVVLNITVFVRNVTNGIVINNTVNATFLNQSNATVRANVTEGTTINNPPVLNMSTATINKTDSPDPANTSGTLTYVLNITSTGPGIARNVTVNETYPPEVIFISAQPTPSSGNNTFFLGNITNGTSVLINITVLVRNISNNTVINNSATVTFQNNTNFTFTAVDSESTTVINVTTETPPAPAPAAGGGSGGGWTTPTVGGVQLEQPVQAPPGPCIENWACDDWSACSLGRQSRACADQNQCNTTQYVPVQARTCMDLTPPAPEPAEEPLALPDIKVEQEAPAIETPRWSICAVMPLIVDGALLVLAVLVLLYLILTARQRAEKYWRTILDAAAGIILILLITQYVTCKEFLPLQYGVFILLALFVLLMRLADHLKARQFAPYTPPAVMPRIPEQEPETEPEADRAELPPLRITKPAKVPANLKALTAAVKRNEKTMQDFLKVLKKK